MHCPEASRYVYHYVYPLPKLADLTYTHTLVIESIHLMILMSIGS